MKLILHQPLKLTGYIPVFLLPQLISEPTPSLPPLLSASLLSEHVDRERDERGKESFRVRTLFHKRGDTSARETCITLHAFKETEEHKASCMAQVRCFLTHSLHRFLSPLFNLSILFPSLHWGCAWQL